MIDNYKDFMKYINNLDYKPKLLIHACCAPCSSHVILLLSKYFDITIFFSNDNIYPKEEYLLRLAVKLIISSNLNKYSSLG